MLEYLKKQRIDLINVDYGEEILKPRLIGAKSQEKITPERVFENGNKLVLEKFSLPNYKIKRDEFLTKKGYPNNSLCLQLFPYNAWGGGAGQNSAQNILNRARALTGTYCYSDKVCWGLQD